MLGRGFGFVLGAVTLFASALLTGGVGPWLPFQMLGAAWVGFGAGCLPPAPRPARGRGCVAAYGAFAGIAYGFLLNLWFWPFTGGLASGLSFVAGRAAAGEPARNSSRSASRRRSGFDLAAAVGTSCSCSSSAARSCARCDARRAGPPSRRRSSSSRRPTSDPGGRLMEVVLLGTGGADGWPNPFCRCASCTAARAAGVVRGQTAALVDDVLLLDCGPEAPRAAARAGRALDRVTRVLLTHAHPDHTGPAALLWRAWAGRREPLIVHGPARGARTRAGTGSAPTTRWRSATSSPATCSRRAPTRSAPSARTTATPAGTRPALDVTDPSRARLLYATDTGWPAEETLDALTTAEPYDLVLLEETFGDASDLGADHRTSRRSPRCSRGCAGAGTGH